MPSFDYKRAKADGLSDEEIADFLDAEAAAGRPLTLEGYEAQGPQPGSAESRAALRSGIPAAAEAMARQPQLTMGGAPVSAALQPMLEFGLSRGVGLPVEAGEVGSLALGAGLDALQVPWARLLGAGAQATRALPAIARVAGRLISPERAKALEGAGSEIGSAVRRAQLGAEPLGASIERRAATEAVSSTADVAPEMGRVVGRIGPRAAAKPKPKPRGRAKPKKAAKGEPKKGSAESRVRKSQAMRGASTPELGRREAARQAATGKGELAEGIGLPEQGQATLRALDELARMGFNPEQRRMAARLLSRGVPFEEIARLAQ